MTVAQIVAHSSNVGTITLAQRLGAGRLASWIDRFGFGKQTGVDFPGEARGLVLPLDDWSGSTIGNVPIGQGIAVTPMQMARAYAAIANGGVLRRSRTSIDRVGGETSRRAERRAASSRRRVAAQMLRDARAASFVEGGTGTEAAIPGYTRRRQDRHRGEDRSGRRLLDVALRRLVRRPRAGDEAASSSSGHGRRAARRHLRRRRRGAGVPRDRAFQPPVPRDPAGRPDDALARSEPLKSGAWRSRPLAV